MSESEGWPARKARILDRTAARMARFGRKARAFTSQPEPKTIGRLARGRQLCAGNFLMAGYLIEAPGKGLWELPMPDRAFEMEAHGFEWLDDLAAYGEPAARRLAQDWAHGWVTLYGRGEGPGWVPELTGRRAMRMINHAVLLLNGQDRATADAFFRALSAQVRFLARRWGSAEPVLPRFEALCGLIYTALSLTGMERHARRARAALGRECAALVDDRGGIGTRNPEELLEVFALLTWTADALSEAGQMPADDHLAAIERIAPVLRALRHADGALARFHGGGRGAPGRLDQALAASGVRVRLRQETAMGYVRLAHGRTTVIADASAPPEGEMSRSAHASTLAFELTSGRRPVVVNCGSGAGFGANWRRAGRATASHSTVSIEGFSSSRLGGAGIVAGRRTELLIDAPREVVSRWPDVGPASAVVMSHDGYERTHGLTHVRRLELSAEGRTLTGDDSLSALDDRAEARFNAVFDRSGFRGVEFQIRFHLHPDVLAELDMGGAAVSLALKSGEIWVFRHDGRARLSLAPSVYLEHGRQKPRATKQIVLSGNAMDYATRIGWTLAKAQDTPSGIRDIALEDDLAAD